MQTTEQLPAVPASPTDGVAMPIVTLNRWILVIGISLGWLLQQPLLTTLLLLLLIPAVLGRQRWSPITNLGKWLFARQIATAEREDARLMRFNNTIAVLLLFAAQLAFAAGLPLVGWTVAGLVVVAASVALAGFCVGCFLYYQFKLRRAAWFGR